MFYPIMVVVVVAQLATIDAASYDGRECTTGVCRLNDTSLRFMLLGDHGGLPIWPYYTVIQKYVAAATENLGEEKDTHFQMALGDNFYMVGVTDANDKRFQSTFENVYSLGEYHQKPWYVLAGNHDHYGNASAEIVYSNKSSRWIFPNYYYPIKYEFGNGTRAEIYVIDTVQLCGNTRESHYSNFFDYLTSGDRSGQPLGPANKDEAEKQWHWLETNLQNSDADYLLVAGHFPVWSIADHGPTECLVNRLRPLLQKYRATAYLCGHDHDLQHLKERNDDNQWTVHYVVSGASAYEEHSERHIKDVPSGVNKFFYPPSRWFGIPGRVGFGKGAFVYVELQEKNAVFQYTKGDNEVLYTFKTSSRKVSNEDRVDS